MPNEVTWEDPQSALRTRESWDEALAIVRAHPGTWARIVTYRGETSAYKAGQKLRSVPAISREALAWDIVAKRLPEGGSALYARFRPPLVGAAAVGEGTGAAPERAHAALRALVCSATPAEAAAVLAGFVADVGGRVVPAGDGVPDAVLVDLSCGDGEPAVATAPAGTAARTALEQLLPPLVEDAHRLMALRRAASGTAGETSRVWGIDAGGRGSRT